MRPAARTATRVEILKQYGEGRFARHRPELNIHFGDTSAVSSDRFRRWVTRLP